MNSQPAPGYYCQQEKQKKLKKIRLLKIVILVLVIIISTLICSLWVLYVHLQTMEDPRLAGYQEFCCSSDNQTCLTLLCPAGTVWRAEYSECLVPTHFTCCTDTSHIFLCFPPALEESSQDCVRFAYNGILFTGHDQFCREGYIWVPWKRKCFRRDPVT